jgi:homoserine dehydrogenase
MVTYRAVRMGFGNVGRAVATLFLQRGTAVERDHGVAVRFVLVADRSGAAVDPAGLDLQRLLDVKARTGGVAAYPGGGRPGLSGAAAIASVAADLLLEVSPTSVRTGEPGLAHLRAALNRAMHVVTANKGPLVGAYRDLMRLAHERGVELRYAGTVAAPTPALDLARYALHGAVVESIEAVPNATTNYILTLMEAGYALEDGIRAAQDVGIAETDPALDVEGWDSAAKIIILANTVMGGDLRLDDVDVEGIGAVTTAQLTQARRQGRALKLLASVRRGPRGLHAAVAPTPLPVEHPLARLRNTAMGVLFHTDLLGDLLVSVEGDAPLGTAQAMLRDVVQIGREHRALS